MAGEEPGECADRLGCDPIVKFERSLDAIRKRINPQGAATDPTGAAKPAWARSFFDAGGSHTLGAVLIAALHGFLRTSDKYEVAAESRLGAAYMMSTVSSGLFGIGTTDFSNGRQGITPIDTINLPWSKDLVYTDFNLKPAYWVALAMVVFTIFVNRRLRDSRLGRAWIAVREDEVAAASMGVNLVRTKLWAYAIGAAFGGFAGAFLGSYNNTVNVDQFEFGFSVFVLAMIIIGGMGNIWGAIVGGLIIGMAEAFSIRFFGADFVDMSVYGLLLVILIVRPTGLFGSASAGARA